MVARSQKCSSAFDVMVDPSQQDAPIGNATCQKAIRASLIVAPGRYSSNWICANPAFIALSSLRAPSRNMSSRLCSGSISSTGCRLHSSSGARMWPLCLYNCAACRVHNCGMQAIMALFWNYFRTSVNLLREMRCTALESNHL